jgi:hypothetical protein
MKTNLLSSDKDPMGTAIADYFHHNKADKLRVFSSQFEEDEIPVNQLFRPYPDSDGRHSGINRARRCIGKSIKSRREIGNH